LLARKYKMMKFVFSLLLALAFAAGPLQLTAKNFNKKVFKGEKDTFVKFLAPW